MKHIFLFNYLSSEQRRFWYATQKLLNMMIRQQSIINKGGNKLSFLKGFLQETVHISISNALTSKGP